MLSIRANALLASLRTSCLAMLSSSLPPDYPNIKIVRSFKELVATPFADGVNALCWPRSLPGDFGEVVARLDARDGITTLDEPTLLALDVSAAGRLAI